MKEKRTLRCFNLFKPNELDLMREYLEQMAEKGWFLTKITGAFQSFEKGKPRKLRYAAEIFDRATVYDTRPESEAEDYIELCREAGWSFCGSYGRVYVFSSETEDALPIETDLEQKYRVICRDLMKEWANQYLSSVLLLLLIEIYTYFQGYEFFYSAPMNLFLIVLLGFMLLCGGWNLWEILHWRSLAKRKLLPLRGNGKPRSLFHRRVLNFLQLFFGLGLIGMFAYFGEVSSLWVCVGIAVLVCVILLWTSTKGWSRESNKAVSIVLGAVVALSGTICFQILPDKDDKQVYVPADQVDVSIFPLTLEDVGSNALAYRWAEVTQEKTFLAEYSYYQDYAKDDPNSKTMAELLVYSVYRSRYPKLLEAYMDYRMKDAVPERTEKLNGDDYGAEEAWWFKNGLLLQYPDKIVWVWPLAERFLKPEALKKAFA